MEDGRYALHYTTVETTTGEKMPASPEFFLFDLTHFSKTLGESLAEEILTYEQDMMTDRDIRNGMKEARAEGLAQGKAEMARAMKATGLDITLISEISGLSEEEISKL